MLRKIFALSVFALASLTSCGGGSEPGPQPEPDPPVDPTISGDKLIFCKDVDPDKVKTYFEANKKAIVQKSDVVIPTTQEEEWLKEIFDICPDTYCYKWYDGRNDSQHRLLYKTTQYYFPINKAFFLKYESYTYTELEVPLSSNVECYDGYIASKINSSLADFGGFGNNTSTTVVYTTGSVSYYDALFNFKIPYFELPQSLSEKNCNCTWALLEATNPTEANRIITKYQNEIADKIFGKLQACFNSLASTLKNIDSSYKVISEK